MINLKDTEIQDEPRQGGEMNSVEGRTIQNA